jgi:hypothetical protein
MRQRTAITVWFPCFCFTITRFGPIISRRRKPWIGPRSPASYAPMRSCFIPIRSIRQPPGAPSAAKHLRRYIHHLDQSFPFTGRNGATAPVSPLLRMVRLQAHRRLAYSLPGLDCGLRTYAYAGYPVPRRRPFRGSIFRVSPRLESGPGVRVLFAPDTPVQEGFNIVKPGK